MKKTTGRTRARRKPVRSATKKTGHKVVRTHTGRRYEFLGLALLAAGLISICGIFGLNVGFVGVYFAKFLRYFFGVGSLLVAFLILLIAWTYMTKHRGPKYSPRFFGILALFISVLAIWHHFKVPVGAEILPESLPTGGGLLGGGFLLLLRKFFGVDGSIIILGVGTVGAVLLSTTWSLAAGLLKTQAQAKKGAAAAGSALQSTYGKAVEVGGRVEAHVAEAVREKVEKVREHGSFYNQAEDKRFAAPAEAAGESAAAAVSTAAAGTGLSEPGDSARAASPMPDFTIEYGQNHEEQRERAYGAEGLEPLGAETGAAPFGEDSRRGYFGKSRRTPRDGPAGFH